MPRHLLLLLVVAALGCTTPRAARVGTRKADVPEIGVPSEVVGSRRLYRLQIDGFEVSGSGRLAMWIWARGELRAVLSDSFGTARWQVEWSEAGTVWRDLRRGLRCTDGPDSLEPALGIPLRVRDLPAVLTGRLPIGERARVSDGGWVDDAGWRWTARRVGGTIVAWTGWQGKEPRIWWRHEDGGGVLSTRQPSGQVRWREVAVEPLGGMMPAPTDSSTEGRCFEGLTP